MQIPPFTDDEVEEIELSLHILFGPFQVMYDLDPAGNHELIVQMIKIAVKHGCHEQLMDIGLEAFFNYCKQELLLIDNHDSFNLCNRNLMEMAVFYEAELYHAIEIHRKAIQRLFDV